MTTKEMKPLTLSFKYDPKLNPVTGCYYGIVSFELEGKQTQISVRSVEFNSENETLDFIEEQLDDDNSPLQIKIRETISLITGKKTVIPAPETKDDN